MHDTGEVDQLGLQLDERIEALATPMYACVALAPADASAWTAYYLGWKSLYNYWINLRATGGVVNSIQSLIDTEGLIGTSIYDQMKSYYDKGQLEPTGPYSWPAKLAAACPSSGYVASPSVVPPDASKSPSTDWAGLAQTLTTAAIAISIAVVGYKGLQIVEDLTSNARARKA